MANKKGLIPFGGLGKQLRATKGSGNALGALRQQTGVAAKKPVNSLAAMQTAVEQRSKLEAIVYGLDYTGSTSRVVNGFKSTANEIAAALSDEYPNIENYFGTMSDRGIELSNAGDSSILDKSNDGADSDVPKFLREALDTVLKDKNSIPFIFGDEIDCPPDGCHHNPQELSSVIETLNERDNPLFFMYERTGGGAQTKEEIKKMLIDPLGEKGFLLDMTEVDVDKILDIIRGCVAYSVKSKVPAAATGGHKIYLQDYLKKVGASGLKISQGEAPKQLGHF